MPSTKYRAEVTTTDDGGIRWNSFRVLRTEAGDRPGSVVYYVFRFRDAHDRWKDAKATKHEVIAGWGRELR